MEVTGATWGEFLLSGGAGAAFSSGRYCTADLADSSQIGTDYPIPVPDSGYNYSYPKSHFLKASSFDDTEINTLRIYTDGTLGWTGCNVWIAKSGNLSTKGYGLPSSQYDQATGTEGTTGDEFWGDNGHAYYSGLATPSANLFDYTAGSPFYIMSGTSADQKITANGYSWGWVTQAQVSSNATHGTKSTETYTLSYNII